jgi:hypothetical protein
VTIPKTIITKYQLRSGWSFQSPREWSVTFFDESDAQVGTTVRTGESFSLLKTREYDVAPSVSVAKAVISFQVTVDRNSTVTRINKAG